MSLVNESLAKQAPSPSDAPRPEILVIGLGVVKATGSTFLTRKAIAEYLAEMARHGRVTWLTALQGGDTSDLCEPLPPEVVVETLSSRNPLANSIRLLYRRRITGVVAAYPMALRVWPALLWVLARRTVFYLGNDFTQKPLKWSTYTDKFLWHYRYLVAKHLSRNCAAVAARGRYLANLSRKRNANTFETVPITMSMTSNEAGEARSYKNPYLLYVGKLIEEKGIALLIEAYCRSNWPVQRPDLVIVGAGSLSLSIAEIAKNDPGIVLLGYSNDPLELATLYREASAVILPTQAEWEGVPRVLTEAQSFGTPLYVTPLKSICAEFGDEVTYIDWPTEPGGLADQLARIPLYHGRREGEMEGAAFAARQHYEALDSLTLDV